MKNAEKILRIEQILQDNSISVKIPSKGQPNILYCVGKYADSFINVEEEGSPEELSSKVIKQVNRPEGVLTYYKGKGSKRYPSKKSSYGRLLQSEFNKKFKELGFIVEDEKLLAQVTFLFNSLQSCLVSRIVELDNILKEIES